MSTTADVRYPVSLILGRTWQQSGRWHFPHWQVLEILPCITSPDTGELQCHPVANDGQIERFLWSGLWLEFFHDGLQGYYQNLTGSHPSLFVLCNSDDSGDEVGPVAISANHADAEAHMESDGIVLETPLTSPFSSWLADYILENQTVFERQLAEYQHTKKGKRRHV